MFTSSPRSHCYDFNPIDDKENDDDENYDDDMHDNHDDDEKQY